MMAADAPDKADVIALPPLKLLAMRSILSDTRRCTRNLMCVASALVLIGLVASARAQSVEEEDQVKQLEATVLPKARTFIENGNYALAKKSVDRLLALYPSSVSARYLRAISDYKMGNFEASIEDCKLIVQNKYGGSIDSIFKADVHHLLGASYAGADMLDEAEGEFEHSLELDPVRQAARYDLGALYSWKGETEKAREQFKSVLANDPKGPYAKHARDALDNLQADPKEAQAEDGKRPLPMDQGTLMKYLGMLIWIIGAIVSLSWSYGVRTYFRHGDPPTKMTINMTMLFTIWVLAVPLFGFSPFHLLWLFPLSYILGMLSLAFPFSLLSIPGYMYATLCCLGLDQGEVARNTERVNRLRELMIDGLDLEQAKRRLQEEIEQGKC